jgi:hypothetical protein
MRSATPRKLRHPGPQPFEVEPTKPQRPSSTDYSSQDGAERTERRLPQRSPMGNQRERKGLVDDDVVTVHRQDLTVLHDVDLDVVPASVERGLCP